jgi:hypothetical protein
MGQKLYGKVLTAVGTAIGVETIYTDSTHFDHARGYAACLITISDSASVTVTQQCSADNSTWYDPKDSSATALGAVAAAGTVASTYRYYTPVLCPFIRFKIVGAVAGKVGLTLYSQED